MHAGQISRSCTLTACAWRGLWGSETWSVHDHLARRRTGKVLVRLPQVSIELPQLLQGRLMSCSELTITHPPQQEPQLAFVAELLGPSDVLAHSFSESTAMAPSPNARTSPPHLHEPSGLSESVDEAQQRRMVKNWC